MTTSICSFSFFLLLCLFSVIYCVEEFCTDFPGDLSFVYETVEDENTYNIMYGSPVIYKYRKIKKTYRPRGRANMPQIQQKQIQQIQQQIFIPNSLNNNLNNVEQQQTNDDHSPRHTEDNETDNSPLPVWKLRMPRNAVEAVVERVEGGKAVDKFRLNNENFENKTTTTYSSDYYRYVDVTHVGIITDAWYAICISLSISVNKKMSSCRYCTLLKAVTTSGGSDKVVDKVEMTEYFTTDSIRLKYRVQDLPFPSASVITKVYLSYDKIARCLNLGKDVDKSVVESVDPIKADTVVYVDLKGISEASEYSITTTLVAEWKDDPKRVPLTALFYLNPGKTQSVPKCSRVSY